jgi:hypothetical protein
MRIEEMLGKWTGTSQLWFEQNMSQSDSAARIEYLAQHQFLSVAYTWQFDGQPQDGMIIFPTAILESAPRAVWLDSWHMREQIMLLETTHTRDGTISLLGSYPAPEGPDWGWRIELAVSQAEFTMHMWNITPSGQEILAVMAQYQSREPLTEG